MPHRSPKTADSGPPAKVYDRVFVLNYMANTALMIGVSLLFRYADFVEVLGGAEFELGAIVGVGTIGAIVARFLLGIEIDRYGPRLIWLVSLALIVLALLAHTQLISIDSVAVYAARVVYHCGLAGAFGASLTFVSLRAPSYRSAEVIGVLGSSGFLGMALGPTLGDWLFHGEEVTRQVVNRMFFCAAASCTVSFLLVLLGTRGKLRKPEPLKINVIQAVRQYHPGFVLVIASAMGIGLSLPGIFLRPYAMSQGIDDIYTFFWTYNVCAFVIRILTVKLSQRIGLPCVTLMGMSCLTLSMPAYLLVVPGSVLSLTVPAMLAGTAHAFLFPSVVASGSATFPTRLRGTATTLTLGMFDMGVLVGAPTVGSIIQLSRNVGIPAYPTMFFSVATFFLAATSAYAILEFRKRRIQRVDTDYRSRLDRADDSTFKVQRDPSPG